MSQVTRHASLVTPKEVPVAPIEYVIIKKLEFYKEGNSHKHIEDIKNMLICSGELIDHNLLSSFIEKFGYNNEWKTILNK